MRLYSFETYEFDPYYNPCWWKNHGSKNKHRRGRKKNK